MYMYMYIDILATGNAPGEPKGHGYRVRTLEGFIIQSM